MTQTPRDWQKDMDLVQGTIRHDAFPAWTAPMLYWLQEAKTLQESVDIAHMAYEGLQEDCVSRGEYASMLGKLTSMTAARKAENARADAAEAREQRLKEAVQTAIQLYEMGESSDVYPLLKDIILNLYPDTPAPKEGE